MKTTKISPAPWVVKDNGMGGWDIYDNLGVLVGSAHGDHRRANNGIPHPAFPTNEEALANSRLFDAAPYLLEACEAALALLTSPLSEAEDADDVTTTLARALEVFTPDQVAEEAVGHAAADPFLDEADFKHDERRDNIATGHASPDEERNKP